MAIGCSCFALWPTAAQSAACTLCMHLRFTALTRFWFLRARCCNLLPIQVHYFLWIIPMIASVVVFYQFGMWYVSVALLAMYVPTFLNNDQYKSGRPWHAFRTHPIWRLTSRYIGIEVVRTKILDPKKKYMFGQSSRSSSSSRGSISRATLDTRHAR